MSDLRFRYKNTFKRDKSEMLSEKSLGLGLEIQSLAHGLGLDNKVLFTPCLKKNCAVLFLNNSVKHWPIEIIFGTEPIGGACSGRFAC